MICLYGKNILSAFSIRDNMVTVLLQNSLSNDIYILFSGSCLPKCTKLKDC